MWALLFGLMLQAATMPTVPNGIGWSVYAPTPAPLVAHDPTAQRCVGRHRGAKRLQVQMRCRIADGVQFADCEVADGQSLARRDLATVQCVAGAQSLPAATADQTMLVTVTVVVP